MSVARSIHTTISIPEGLYAALAKDVDATHASTAWTIHDAPPLRLDEQDKSSVELESNPAAARQAGKKGKSA